MDLSLHDPIEIPLCLAWIQISSLRKFYDEAEEHFNFGLDRLKAEIGDLTPEEWEKAKKLLLRGAGRVEVFKEAEAALLDCWIVHGVRDVSPEHAAAALPGRCGDARAQSTRAAVPQGDEDDLQADRRAHNETRQ